MTKPHRRPALAPAGVPLLLALALAAPVFLRAQDADDSEGVSIQFNNSSIHEEILVFYEMLTGRKVIRDAAIQAATLTIETSGRVPREEAAEFIEKSLLLNGFALIPAGRENLFKIIAFDSGKQPRSEGVPVVVDPAYLPPGEEVVTFIMPLSHASPAKAAETLTQIIPLHSYGNVTALENASAIVITENSSVIRAMLELRSVVDVKPSEIEDRIFQLTRADAEQVAESVSQILGIGSDTAGRAPSAGTVGRSAGGGADRIVSSAQIDAMVDAAGAAGTSAAGPAPVAAEPKIVPIPRTNSILVVAESADMERIGKYIDHLDSPGEHSFTLERKLSYLAVSAFLPIVRDTLLRGYTGGSGGDGQISGGEISQGGGLGGGVPGTGATGMGGGMGGSGGFGSSRGGMGAGGRGAGGAGGGDFGGAGQDADPGPQSLVVDKTLIVADNVQNSIIASGPPEHLDLISDLLDRMDVRPRQIQISAIIAQLTLGDEFNMGLDLLRTLETTGPDGRRYNGAGLLRSRSGGLPNINDLDQIDGFLPAASGFSFYGQVNPYLNAYLSMLESTSRFKVLSRPTIYTVNNRQAVIQTGQRIAVPRSTLSTVNPDQNNPNQSITASIDFEEVLLRIEVLPLINAEDEITLRINQLNDDIVGSQRIGGDDIPTIGTQSLGTTVMIPDGSTVLLGGLISEQERDSESGAPLFANIPLVGKVFGSESKTGRRQELLIFIQPKIIDDYRGQQAADQDLTTRTEVGPAAEAFAGNAPVAVAKPARSGWLRRIFQGKD